MKRVIFPIVIALSAVFMAPVAAENANVQMRGDSLVVVDGGDTITVAVSGLKQLVGKISDKMGDTLVDKSGMAAGAIDESDVANENDLAMEQIYAKRENEQNNFVTSVTAIVFGTILLIVLFSLITYYMRRRAKYRIIEKAIENGYELPDSFYEQSACNRPPVMPEPPVMPNQPNVPQQPVAPVAYNDDLFYRLRWHRGARSGMKLSVFGLCFVVFGMVINEEFFAAIGLALLLIGAAKIALGYFDVRVPVYPKQPTQPQQPMQPNVPQQPVQPTQSQQPITPPPFTDGRASITSENNA